MSRAASAQSRRATPARAAAIRNRAAIRPGCGCSRCVMMRAAAAGARAVRGEK